MGSFWVVASPSTLRLAAAAIESALSDALPAARIVDRLGGPARALVWEQTHLGRWMEGSLSEAGDAVYFRGWPELFVDHILMFRSLIPEGTALVIANTQGDIHDLRALSDRQSLLAALEIDGVATNEQGSDPQPA